MVKQAGPRFLSPVQPLGDLACQWHMKHPSFILLFFTMVIFFSSCIQQNFLHSPLQGLTTAYHPVPVASDSAGSATYVNAALSAGGMNELLRDGVYSGQVSVHRGVIVRRARFFYGAVAFAGDYDVNKWVYEGQGVTNLQPGDNFFGGVGAFGGASLARPIGRFGEWRYIGIEGSLSKEFGSYYQFRKNLADSLAQEIDRKNYLGSLGLSTEWIFKSRHAHEFGIKLGMGSFLRTLPYSNRPSYYYGSSHTSDALFYFTNAWHFTYRQSTTWFQFSFATHAAHFQVGYSRRL